MHSHPCTFLMHSLCILPSVSLPFFALFASVSTGRLPALRSRRRRTAVACGVTGSRHSKERRRQGKERRRQSADGCGLALRYLTACSIDKYDGRDANSWDVVKVPPTPPTTKQSLLLDRFDRTMNISWPGWLDSLCSVADCVYACYPSLLTGASSTALRTAHSSGPASNRLRLASPTCPQGSGGSRKGG